MEIERDAPVEVPASRLARPRPGWYPASSAFVRRGHALMTSQPLISLHKGDLPEGIDFGDSVAIDTETLGLIPRRDRLCVVQLSSGDGSAHVVQIAAGQKHAPNLERLLADPKVTKLFH